MEEFNILLLVHVIQGIILPFNHANLSCSSILKETNKMSEDEGEDCYIGYNSQSTQRAGYLKVIGSTTKEEESVYDNDTDDTGNVKVNLNPSHDSFSVRRYTDTPTSLWRFSH